MGTLVHPYMTEQQAKEFRKKMSKSWPFSREEKGSVNIDGLIHLVNDDSLMDMLASKAKKSKSDARPFIKEIVRRFIEEDEHSKKVDGTLKGWNLVRQAVGLKAINSHEASLYKFKKITKALEKKRLRLVELAELEKRYQKSPDAKAARKIVLGVQTSCRAVIRKSGCKILVGYSALLGREPWFGVSFGLKQVRTQHTDKGYFEIRFEGPLDRKALHNLQTVSGVLKCQFKTVKNRKIFKAIVKLPKKL